MKNNYYEIVKFEYEQADQLPAEEKLNFLLQRLNKLLKKAEINNDNLEIEELKREIKKLQESLLVKKNKLSPSSKKLSLSPLFEMFSALKKEKRERKIEEHIIYSLEQNCFRLELLYLFYFYIYPEYGLNHIDEKDFGDLSNKKLFAVLENQFDKIEEERAELEKGIYESSRFQQKDDDHFKKADIDNDTDTFKSHSESRESSNNDSSDSDSHRSYSRSRDSDSDSYSSDNDNYNSIKILV